MSLCALREAQPPNNVWMSLYKPHFLGMKLSFHFWSPVSFLADQFPIFSFFRRILFCMWLTWQVLHVLLLRFDIIQGRVKSPMAWLESSLVQYTLEIENGCWKWWFEMWLLAKIAILCIHVKFPAFRLCKVSTLCFWLTTHGSSKALFFLNICIYISSAAFHWPLFVTGSVDTPGISWSSEMLNICKFLQIRDPQINKVRVKFI